MAASHDTVDIVETAAVVALLRGGNRPPSHYADVLETVGSARAVLEQEAGLLAQEQLELALADVATWTSRGVRLLSVLDPQYPENLRAVHDRPALIFLAGELRSSDERAVSIIGSRRASSAGLACARAAAEELVSEGFVVASGLAQGIDTVAHTTALELGARTIAVIGTGVDHCYPARNAQLQRRIASDGAVVSQFWPDQEPTRETFPRRNAVMSGLSLATVIVEASRTSGARIQARHALAHGRPVLVMSRLLDQPWARQLASRPGVHVIRSPDELASTVERLSSVEAPTC